MTPQTMLTDFHAHFLPDDLLARLKRRSKPPYVDGDALHIVAETLKLHKPLVDGNLREALVREYGFAKQVLSIPGLFGVDSLPGEDGKTLTASFNDGIARMVQDRDWAIGLASLPLADLNAAEREADRALDVLGLAGVIIPTSVVADQKSATDWMDLFKIVADKGGFVFLHPGPMPGQTLQSVPDEPPLLSMHRHVGLRLQEEISHGVLTLLYSDIMDQIPGLRFQIANLGGTLPFLSERMKATERWRTGTEQDVQGKLKRLFFDTASFGPSAIGMAADVFGESQIVIGTDMPVMPSKGPTLWLDAIGNAGRLGVVENAKRLLG